MKVPILVWFLIPTFILVGAGVWFFSKNPHMGSDSSGEVLPAQVSSPVEGTQDYEIVGRNHITQGTLGSGYNSNPPSSGPHWPAAAKNGAYENPLPDEQLIHDLEHGYVWISYKPDISQDVKNQLKEIVEKDDWKVVLCPREKNDSQIALVSWGRVLKLDQFDAVKVKDFVRTYRNRGPEKTPE